VQHHYFFAIFLFLDNFWGGNFDSKSALIVIIIITFTTVSSLLVVDLCNFPHKYSVVVVLFAELQLLFHGRRKNAINTIYCVFFLIKFSYIKTL